MGKECKLDKRTGIYNSEYKIFSNGIHKMKMIRADCEKHYGVR